MSALARVILQSYSFFLRLGPLAKKIVANVDTERVARREGGRGRASQRGRTTQFFRCGSVMKCDEVPKIHLIYNTPGCRSPYGCSGEAARQDN